MSTPEITPELLRAVADVADSAAPVGGNQIQFALRRWADRLEREQADEKRIDELAPAYWEAYRTACSREEGHYPHEWDRVDPWQRATVRAGVRAVIAAYDPEGRLTAPQEHIGASKTEAPRKWASLDDVPDDVRTVRNASDDLLCRTLVGWHNTEWNLRSRGTDGGPFTESSRYQP